MTMMAFRGFADSPEPRMAETELPEVGDHDVLVKIKSAGIATGFLHLLRAGMIKPLPTTMGHEGAGVIDRVGRQVTSVKVGDRVRIYPNLSCGRCSYCLTGREQMCPYLATMGFAAFGRPVDSWQRYHNGFVAEYALAPATHVDKLPDNVSFDVGAKLHYLANAMYNLETATLPPGSTVAIFGATGAMAVSTVAMLPAFGVKRVVLIGRSSARLAEVSAISQVPCETIGTDKLGDDWAKSGELLRRAQELLPDGADAMLDYLPDGGDLWQALPAVATGGSIVSIGGGMSPFSLPMRLMIAKCVRLIGARNHSRADTLKVMKLLREGELTVDHLISHRTNLANTSAAVDQLRSRSQSLWMSVVSC